VEKKSGCMLRVRVIGVRVKVGVISRSDVSTAISFKDAFDFLRFERR